jgi:hypothetical protein
MKNGVFILLFFLLSFSVITSCDRKSNDKKSRAIENNPVDTTMSATPAAGSDSTQNKVTSTVKSITDDSLTNLHTIQSPNTTNIIIRQAYINSIEKVTYKDKKVLLIKGDLPDGCCQLYNVHKAIDGDTLSLAINTWKQKDKVCTQALKPFTFIYDGLGYFEYKSVTFYKIDGKVKAF